MKKILLLLSVLLLCALTLNGCGVSLGTLYPDGDTYSSGNVTLSAVPDTLILHWSAGEVTLLPSDTDTVTIEETSNIALTEEQSVHWRLDGNELRIEYCASGVPVPSDAEKRLTVTCPASAFSTLLELSSASGDIHAGETNAETVRISTASGNTEAVLRGTSSASFDAASGTVSAALDHVSGCSVDTASGAVSLTLDHVSGCSVETASGDVSLALDNVSDCSVDTASGKITLSGSAERIRTDSASGAAVCTVECRESLSVETSSGDITVRARVLPEKTVIDTASGSVSLFTAEDAGFTAEVSTASGDFSSELPVTVVSEKQYRCGDGSAAISISTASGDISVFRLQ